MLPGKFGPPDSKSRGNTGAIAEAAKAADTRPRIDWAYQPPESPEKADNARARRLRAMREGQIEARTEHLLARVERLTAALAAHRAANGPASAEQLQSLAAQFRR